MLIRIFKDTEFVDIDNLNIVTTFNLLLKAIEDLVLLPWRL